ncbi:IclR family transcriptional regulator [Actomonas aquatica]|uniref:IclR family transcriptional regulator n=1 Tax=Actomonas aquatica TaxID=2866162 RepID=A0ABZ1CAF4_9BACT|nr:IclR family transcriptional regulator [Opitutus sp. WL0086]WRQ87300.1 IclR family transcriptional regulator [Opitutus sp. WL0086]
MDDKYIIPNLRNACRVLKLIGQENRGYKITELAKPLGIPSTTALRITTTLQAEGLLRRENGLYFLGPVLIHLGSRTLADTELRDLAFPVLEKLSHTTAETAHLALPCDDRSLIAAVCDSPHPLRAASSPGTLTDLYASATGKVFLAFLHRDRIGDIINRFPPKPRTSKSLTTLAELEAAADETAMRGFGLDDEEFNHGVRCLAAPVVGPQGEVVAAMGITAATLRFSSDRIPEIAAKVMGAASELSRLIGHH